MGELFLEVFNLGFQIINPVIALEQDFFLRGAECHQLFLNFHKLIAHALAMGFQLVMLNAQLGNRQLEIGFSLFQVFMFKAEIFV